MADNSYWSVSGDQGMIKISEDVVASIAAIATSETEGVSGLYSSLTSDIAGFLGKKNFSKGVKVQFDGDTVAVEICFLTIYGFGIREVAESVQESVKSSIESMTGLSVAAINVHVGGVAFDRPEEEAVDSVPCEETE